MPLKYFICPDNQKIEISECLKEGGCRMGNRCATRSYLQLVSSERVWTGKPSTTQLINGTMLAFLKLTVDYAVSPDSRAFMIHGTKGHGNLEAAEDEFSQLELKFDGDNIDETGIADVIESEAGKNVLVDYKTSGSYKVAKALGFVPKYEETGEIYKSGKKKGQPRMRKIIVRDDTQIDREDWEWQLNKYRIEYEKKFNKKIDELKIQCIVRDGNTYIARNRGVFRNIYYFKINIIPDAKVLAYFKRKRVALLNALRQGHCERTCNRKENWDGLRCQRYCEVAEYCPYGKYLIENKRTEDEMIKGLSEVRRLPRLGCIRLGMKMRKDKSGKIIPAEKDFKGSTFPREVDYFIIDPKTPNEEENQKIKDIFYQKFGEQPKQIQIMFPLPDENIFFQQYYKRYGKTTSLKCKGDGETAICASNDFVEKLKVIGETDMGNPKVMCEGRNCPYYENNECSEVGTLQFLIPELPGAGIWQISTGSYHSIVELNSCIEYIRAICGRVHMIPLTLERRKREIVHEGKKRNHYILQLNMSFALTELQRLAQIDPTKISLQLPEPESEIEDIVFQENKEIEDRRETKEYITEEDVLELRNLLTKYDIKEQQILDYKNIKKLTELEKDDYKRLCNMIIDKKEKEKTEKK